MSEQVPLKKACKLLSISAMSAYRYIKNSKNNNETDYFYGANLTKIFNNRWYVDKDWLDKKLNLDLDKCVLYICSHDEAQAQYDMKRLEIHAAVMGWKILDKVIEIEHRLGERKKLLKLFQEPKWHNFVTVSYDMLSIDWRIIQAALGLSKRGVKTIEAPSEDYTHDLEFLMDKNKNKNRNKNKRRGIFQ